MTTWASYGDLGDCVFLMPCMRLMPQPVIFYMRDGLRLEDPFTAKLPILAPLLLSQSYVADVKPWNNEAIDYDASFFRDGGLPFGVTLGHLQAQWIGLNPNFSQPWLHVEPRKEAAIVVHRSPRYHNMFFPWWELVRDFGDEMIMIGARHEHQDFTEQFGDIPYLPTENLLEAAQIIAGAELFIGNQSCCNAIAIGLGQNLIQEVSLGTPDCIYPRPNATYCHDGALDFTFHGKRLRIKGKMINKAHLGETPPGGWRVRVGPCSAQSYSFDILMQEIVTKLLDHKLKVPINIIEMILDQSSTKESLNHPITRLKAELGA